MIGQTINQYKILEKIGSGGMGTVYKALDTKLDRFVALKFLAPHLSQADEEKKRFIHEAKAISALEHINICNIFEINETDDGQMFIAMAYYEGASLKDKIKKELLPLDEAIDIAIQIATGLAKAHLKDIIHRDIKPANILITKDNEVKIVDFGLAKLAGKSMLTKEGTTLGTIAYMSPEQARGTEVDQRTDIWALGVVLYEMLTGIQPFKGDFDQAVLYSIINEDPKPITKINPSIPIELQNIVNHALQKDPESRYSSINKMLNSMREYRDSTAETGELTMRSFIRKIKKPRIAVPTTGVMVIIIIGALWYFNHRSNIIWAKEKALPQIENLVNYSWRDFTDAYKLEEAAEKYIPKNPELNKLIAKSSLIINIKTNPAGAKVYCKQYSQPDEKWKYLGITPIEKIRLPIGIFRWKFEKEGYDTVFAAASTWDVNVKKHNIIIPYNLTRVMDKTDSIPTGMVRVLGTNTQFGEIGDFFIDKYEVTNKQFKKFINNGGYKNKKYWKNEFIKDEKVLTWQEAMKLFVDQTGRPGPAGWKGGDYPKREEDYPVSGISWYEAAAYAEFAGKELPTGTHWGLARGELTPLIRVPQLGGYAVFAPYSNFKDNGPIPVGSLPGISVYGAYDMAGNVREWCWNKAPNGRLIRGGSWNDNTYMFKALSQAPSFDRSSTNGFRCALYPDRKKIPKQVFEKTPFDKDLFYSNQKPVPDNVFKVYKEQFYYDKTQLNSQTISKYDSSNNWIHEKISFNAAYNNERIIAHLFLPKNSSPPYQTIIYFPGGPVLSQKSSDNIKSYFEFYAFLSYLIKNGRAVLFPVYKGTFERRDNDLIPPLLIKEGKLHRFSEYRIMLVKDFERCIDYLETRNDIDTSRLAFYGVSWGGLLGGIILAVEKRLKVSIIISGGFFDVGLPEVNVINYLPRVKIPTLMLNGKYDMIYPYNNSIKPMYDLLGTPKKDKELKVYETDHIPPEKEIIKESLSWLDKYLGPVK